MAEDGEEGGTPLMSLLDLQSSGQGVFIAPPAPSGGVARMRVFGGQVLAQGLAAACFTVPPEVPCHSLHAYFARPGIPARPIEYEVSAMRDGQSFVLRNVAAVQRDELTCQLLVSFGRDTPGPDYQPAMPDVPPPESFPPEAERLERLLEKAQPLQRAFLQQRSPIESIAVDTIDWTDPTPARGPVRGWFRVREQLVSDPRLHQCALAFASDMGLLGPSVRAIGGSFGDPELQIASLDHALWFHRPFEWNDWLLFVFESLSVAGGRGLSRASIYKRDGQLVASVAQEGLMRTRDPLASPE
jgi:acyl-CoA thioesterase II